jgi:hypothetical protein
VAERKSFLLRVDREVLDAVQRWANDDLRSLNSQVEYLLREALKRGGRPVQRSEDQLLTDISDAPYGAEE